MSKFTNRLINEKSPYLLQHAHNPVNWFAWGKEAFDVAKKLNRPIFLSIGYSTCHWCHVMEHESFEDESIAKQLNDNFISIKVDREERPDIDRNYMSFVQAMSGHGGWPLSVFMTPNREPFLGGTYFPPNDSPSQTGFRSVLKLVSDKWNEDPENTKQHAEHLVKVLKDAFKSKRFEGELSAKDVISKCYNYLRSSFDKEGGFGIAPKFPEPSNLIFLAYYCTVQKTGENYEHALKMLSHTLDKMAQGGIHDHIGGGFHRYSVDGHWHVPHFEKMLYDQAQLLVAYSQAHMLGKDYKSIIEDIVAYVKECLTSKEGGFYSAEDADSLPTAESTKKVEGAFYVWTKDEIESILGDYAPAGNENITLDEIFSETFNVKPDGNVPKRIDIHGELTGKNVLIRSKPIPDLAKEFKLSEKQFQKALSDCYEELKKYRDKRPRPHLDNKILTSWCSLTITGLVYAARALPENEKEYLEMAENAFNFLANYSRKSDGSLIRSAYVDQDGNHIPSSDNAVEGFADDYACFIQACLDLYEMKFDERYLQFALETQEVFDAKFLDQEDKAGYYYTSVDNAVELFTRPKPEHDGAEPSANSVAALNLVRMAEIFGRQEYKDVAMQIFRGAGSLLNRNPHAAPLMICALGNMQSPTTQIIVAGTNDNVKECQEMINIVKPKLISNRILIYVNNSNPEGLILSKNSHVKEVVESIKEPTAMVCSGNSCSLPANNATELIDRLNDL